MKFVAKENFALTLEERAAILEMMQKKDWCKPFTRKEKDVFHGIVSRCPIYSKWVKGKKGYYQAIYDIVSEELFLYGEMEAQELVNRISFLLNGNDWVFIAKALSSAATHPKI